MSDKTLNIKGTLMSLSTPVVMGILNVTPDSFYAGSRKQTEADIEERIQAILSEGGQIIDIGGYSSRPMQRRFRRKKRWNGWLLP